MTQTPAQRKAAERQRLRDAGLVAVTVWINAADRVKLARYVKRLNERAATPTGGGWNEPRRATVRETKRSILERAAAAITNRPTSIYL